MDIKRTVLAGILAGIVIDLILLIFGTISIIYFGFYPQAMFPIFAPEGLARGHFGNPTIGVLLAPLVLGIGLAFLYAYVKESFKGEDSQKTLKFGILVWFICTIPTFVLFVTSLTYPQEFYLSYLIGSLLYMVLASGIIVKVVK